MTSHSFNLIMLSDGTLGLHCDHSWGDRVALLRFCNDIDQDANEHGTITNSIGIYSPWNVSKKSRTKKGNYIAFTPIARINWWIAHFSSRPLLLRNTSLPEVSVQSLTTDSALVIWLMTRNANNSSPRLWRMHCQLLRKQPKKVFANSPRSFEVIILV